MSDPFIRLGEDERRALRKEAHPDWRGPMLSVLSDKRFSDPNWLFERKLDGERALAFRDGTQFHLLSRNRKALDRTYPELSDALRRQSRRDFIVDGEIVTFDGKVPSFARLQQRMQIEDPEEARASGVPVFYYLFDVLHLEGYDVRPLPLRRRKQLLLEAVDFEDPLRYCRHENQRGEELLDEACRAGWEGLIAKRAESRYVSKRSSDWLKLKCARGQELVIGGFTEPEGSRIGFRALHLGYYEDGTLRYAGKVGTGFDHEVLERLAKDLGRIARESSPFVDLERARGTTWVEPELVAEIGFTEWTDDGKLRHPRFRGLRRDKDPEDVRRELPGG